MVAHAQLDRVTRLNAALRVPADRLEAICRKYHVRSLRMFGSAISSRFSQETSDIDLAVEFSDRIDLPWYGQITGLISELTDLFGRPVDVVDQEHLRNEELRQNITLRSILIFGEAPPQPNGVGEPMDESQEQLNRVRGVLRDIVECCHHLVAFTADKEFNDFQGDKMLQLAAERLLITIGEAANGLRKADPAAEASIGSLKEIVAMRNRLVHQYWTADQKLLWDVIQKHVPILQEQASSYLQTHKP